MTPWLVLAALAFDACIGYPPWLHARIAHPVSALGRLIAYFDRRWNREHFTATVRRLLGVATLIIVAGTAALLGWSLAAFLAGSSGGGIVLAALASIGVAQRSLYEHVREVLIPLEREDLYGARQAVAKIVGRDVTTLDTSGVAAAATESLAESFCDGIVAPAFWLLLGGLPGLFAYKAINTADSMIGHLENRWRAFGWAAARADDLANWVPARLAGALISAAGRGGLRIMWRDARKHASPNAGWPEAAMAGALGVQLGGSTTYEGIVHLRAIFGDGNKTSVRDLRRAMQIYLLACALLWCAIGSIGVIREIT